MASFFGFPFQPPSEEEQEEMRQAHDRNQMALDEFRHSFQRLFDELDKDQLRTFATMLNLVVNATGSVLAASWEGMALQSLKTRYNVCIACGVNHDEEVHVPPKAAEVGPEQKAQEADIPLPLAFTEQDHENMKKYHLDDVYDSDTKEFLYFVCTGIKGMKGPCGVTYPTIQDRMLNGPEHCSGCFARMSQG
jgi:hypothetical protein